VPWTVDLKSLDGGTTELAGAPFRSGSVTWALDGPGSAEFNLRAEDVASGEWLYGRRRVVVKNPAGTAKFAGWLDSLERGGSPDAADYRASARGLRVMLDQRVVHGNFDRIETPVQTIVTDLLAHAKAQTSGTGPNLLNDWTMGTVHDTPGTSRTRYYCDGDNIGEAIRELAEMTGGFAWEITPSAQLEIWLAGRGTDVSASVTIDEEDTSDWQVTADVTDLATYVTGLGDRDDNSPCGAPLVIDFSTLRDTYGRREVVVESESNDETELEEKTTTELEARAASRLNVHTSWIEGRGPWAFGTRWLGDIVSVDTGVAFEGPVDMRLISVTLTLEGLQEFVEYEWERA
jgi:hypothetical protein